MKQIKHFFNLKKERGVLRLSITATLFVAISGIVFGLMSGSVAIMFDGMYDLVDAGMSLLSLVVVKLISSYANSTGLSPKLQERFTMGFWHLEPMVLGLNGTLLIGIAIYAVINAINSLLQGGRELEFGIAIVYAVIIVLFSSVIVYFENKANKKIKSAFISLDLKSWIMATGITAALLVAFIFGLFIKDSTLSWITPYIDPIVLIIICLILIPLPVSTIKQALSEIMLVTPTDLKSHVDDVAQEMLKKYSFLKTYRAYVAKQGRSKEIELYFIVKDDMPDSSLKFWDDLRDEIGEKIGEDNPHRWLTIVFTNDIEWAE
ncbi:MAG: cation diffusion facilitator family transporter [Campylobacteraceae bacterium]